MLDDFIGDAEQKHNERWPSAEITKDDLQLILNMLDNWGCSPAELKLQEKLQKILTRSAYATCATKK